MHYFAEHAGDFVIRNFQNRTINANLLIFHRDTERQRTLVLEFEIALVFG